MNKKTIALLGLGLFAFASAAAQAIGEGIAIRELTVAEAGDSVHVIFTADVPRGSVRGDRMFAFAPVLTDGNYAVSLPPVIVQGPRAERNLRRYEWAVGDRAVYRDALYAGNGSSIRYAARVEAQEWMQGADLVLESVSGGCCTYEKRPAVTLASDLQLRQEQRIRILVEQPQTGFVPKTLGDTLSLSFAFVANASEFDPERPFRIYDDERENALIVYYPVGSSLIDKQYRDNEQTLLNLTTVVEMLQSARESEVEHIVIGGFSSPDGRYAFNDRLAFERAISIKRYLMDQTGVSDATVLVYNGSVDWRGLRYLVFQSNLPEKAEVIRIIDNVPVESSAGRPGRLTQLMRLEGGSTYQKLLHEYFPLLRNGAFIKVYYKNED